MSVEWNDGVAAAGCMWLHSVRCCRQLAAKAAAETPACTHCTCRCSNRHLQYFSSNLPPLLPLPTRRGFEVSLTAAGVRRTIAPVRGCFYEFYLSGPDSGELVVAEVEAAIGQRMQLLDPGADLSGGSWGAELPRRLRELHSHWLDRWAWKCIQLDRWAWKCIQLDRWAGDAEVGVGVRRHEIPGTTL